MPWERGGEEEEGEEEEEERGEGRGEGEEEYTIINICKKAKQSIH